MSNPERWKPSVTVAAIVERDGRYLLVEEQTREGLRLNNPAGHLDPEESLLEAVVRETLEETACGFTPEALVGVYLSRFRRPLHAPGETGAPLLEGLAPIFECKVWARYPGGDHTILVGEVVRMVERRHDPLLFHSGELRRIDAPGSQRRAPPLASNSFARNYLAYLLARASFIVSNEFHARLGDWDLTVPEWRVLACLMDVEGLSVGELAAMALMKQPRLTKVLDRMERDGLLQRRATSGDRRRVTIHLTAKGRARVEPVQRAAKAHEAEVLKQFTDEERATIKYALDLLIDRQTPEG